MLGARDQVDTGTGRQCKVALACWVGGEQRSRLLPIFGGRVGFDHQRIGAVSAHQRAGFAGERIGDLSRAEGKPVLGIVVVFVLGRCAARLREGMIGEDLSGASGVRIDAVEHLAPPQILVHAELDMVAQEAAGLRAAEGDRMADAAALPRDRIGRSLLVGAFVAQERHHVARRGIAHADDSCPCRLVPQLVDRDRGEFLSLRAAGGSIARSRNPIDPWGPRCADPNGACARSDAPSTCPWSLPDS